MEYHARTKHQDNLRHIKPNRKEMVTGKPKHVIDKIRKKTAYRIEVYPSVLDSSGITIDDFGKSKDRNKKQHTVPFPVLSFVYSLFRCTSCSTIFLHLQENR